MELVPRLNKFIRNHVAELLNILQSLLQSVNGR